MLSHMRYEFEIKHQTVTIIDIKKVPEIRDQPGDLHQLLDAVLLDCGELGCGGFDEDNCRPLDGGSDLLQCVFRGVDKA